MEKIIWFFFVYAFLGWVAEVIFAWTRQGVFVNRGFLNGPICPVYGFGVLAVLHCLLPFHQNVLELYIGSVVLTSALELGTGFLMEKLFHHKWWDYSREPLNIGGYVCLKFSLLWGAACVLVVDAVHPVLSRLVALIPEPISTSLLIVFGTIFITDIAVSVATVGRLNQRLQQISEIAHAIRSVSDVIGSTAVDGTIALSDTNKKIREDLKARHDELMDIIHLEQKRLLRAFPNIQSRLHRETMEEIKARFQARIKERHGRRLAG